MSLKSFYFVILDQLAHCCMKWVCLSECCSRKLQKSPSGGSSNWLYIWRWENKQNKNVHTDAPVTFSCTTKCNTMNSSKASPIWIIIVSSLTAGFSHCLQVLLFITDIRTLLAIDDRLFKPVCFEHVSTFRQWDADCLKKATARTLG